MQVLLIKLKNLLFFYETCIIYKINYQEVFMRLLLLMLLLSANIFAATEVELRRRIQRNPSDMQAYAELIELSTTRAQIVQVGNEAIAAVGQRFQIHTALGNAYMNARDYNGAVNSYRTAIGLNPKSATGYNRLGLALMRISYFRQAEVAFRAAMAYSTPNTAVYLSYKSHLAIVYENLKEYDKAKTVVQEVLQVNSNHATALQVQSRLNQL